MADDAELVEERVRLLGALRLRFAKKIEFAEPIKRRIFHPDSFGNMFNPLRTRRDYTSVGRPVFLVEELPPDLAGSDDES